MNNLTTHQHYINKQIQRLENDFSGKPFNLKLTDRQGKSTNYLAITHKQLLAIREILLCESA